MTDTTLTVTTVYNPFSKTDRDVVVIPHTAGMMLSDIAATHLPRIKDVEFVFSVNGLVIFERDWSTTYIMPGDSVCICSVLQGGGGGNGMLKNILRIVVAVIATIVAILLPASSPWAATAWGVAIGSWIGAIGGIIATLVAPKPASIANNGYLGMDTSNSYGWQPLTTQQQGIVIPRWYGRNKVYGNIIATSVDTIGSQQYINVLLCLGMGRLGQLSNFKINRNEYANIRGVQLVTRMGDLSQPIIPAFNDTKLQYPQNNKVAYGSPVNFATVGSDFDSLEIQVSFSQGLSYYNDQGNLSPYSVNFAIEVRKQGDVDWIPITNQVRSYQATVNEPHWVAGGWMAVYPGGNLDSVPEYVWAVAAEGNNTYSSHYEGEWWGYSGAMGSGTTFPAYWTWMTSPYVKTITESNPNYTATASQAQPLSLTFRYDNVTQGRYDIKVYRTTPEMNNSRYAEGLFLTSVTEILNDDLTYPRMALCAVRALATDQLSGSFSFECQTNGSVVRVYNGTVWNSFVSENPAWICFDILTQPVFDNDMNVVRYDGIDPARLDATAFLEWANFCDELVPDGNGGTEKRITFNGGFDSAKSMWDTALVVASAGRAMLMWSGVNITVSVDKPGTPVQLFSVGNMALDSFEEQFLPMADRAGKIEVDFIDSTNDFARTKFTIVDPDAAAGTGSASMQLQGCISPSQAWRQAMYMLNSTRLLSRTCTFQADIDAIACTVGDVINIQHDVPIWGEGGRIVSATANTVTLDKAVIIETGKLYSIIIRLSDNTIVERSITDVPGTYTELTVSSAFGTLPEAYDVYAFGETDRLVKPFRVVGIEPAGDLKRKLICLEYNESIYGSDLGEPVIPNVVITPVVRFESITGLAVTERMVKNAGGGIDTIFDVTFDNPKSLNTTGVEIFYSYLGNTKSAGVFRGGGCSFNVIDNVNYTIHAASVTLTGTQKLADATSITKLSIGKVAPPSNVTGFKLAPSINGGGLKAVWNAIPDIDAKEYVIRYNPKATGALWEEAGELLRTTSTYAQIPIALLGTYLIKAVDTTGFESLAADDVLLTTVVNQVGMSSHSVFEEHPLWTGNMSQLQLVSDELHVAWLISLPDGPITQIDATYELLSEIDFGLLATARVSAQVEWRLVRNEFDSIVDFDGSGNFDSPFSTSTVTPYIVTSQDASAPTDEQPLFAADYTFQRAKFGFRATAVMPDSVIIEKFTVFVDIHDEVITL